MTGSQSATVAPRWYEVVDDDSLRQGDIFRALRAFWLPDDLCVTGNHDDVPAPVSLEHAQGDWIVLTASCDMERTRKGQVLLASITHATQENLKVGVEKDRRERLEVIRKGFDPLRFLLAECADEPQLPLSFVAYRTQVLLPISYLRRNCTGPRLRLRSPHREKFGAWAGANLARVGIEDSDQINIGGKEPWVGSSQILRSVDP